MVYLFDPSKHPIKSFSSSICIWYQTVQLNCLVRSWCILKSSLKWSYNIYLLLNSLAEPVVWNLKKKNYIKKIWKFKFYPLIKNILLLLNFQFFFISIVPSTSNPGSALNVQIRWSYNVYLLSIALSVLLHEREQKVQPKY